MTEYFQSLSPITKDNINAMNNNAIKKKFKKDGEFWVFRIFGNSAQNRQKTSLEGWDEPSGAPCARQGAV